MTLKRYTNLIARLPLIASKSTQIHQHAAFVVKGGVPVAWGFNHISGNRTIHAEVDAIRRYLSGRSIKCREKGSYLL
jgi:hypothetical protein